MVSVDESLTLIQRGADEIIPAEEDDQKTMVTMKSIQFNAPINDSFFSIQNMKRLR